MVAYKPILKVGYFGLAAVGAAYAIFVYCLTNQHLQRHALYAHKIVNAWWADPYKPQSFGFAKNQVTPFNITTPDNETLFAWHVLPFNVYEKHEDELLDEPVGPVNDRFPQTKAFKLLTEDPKARLVINFHGNAGNIAQGWRTSTYRSLTTLPNVHVLTLDYRGFGHSTGSPSEAGLITDGAALVAFALETLRIPPARIVILGQSLGTAVATAVGLQFTAPEAGLALLPQRGQDDDFGDALKERLRALSPVASGAHFAGVVLAAPFTSLPVLVDTYRIFGIVPILSPMRQYPRIQNWLRSHIVDEWNTQGRIEALVRESATNADDKNGRQGKAGLHLHIVHAKNDFEIPWKHGQQLWETASEKLIEVGGGEQAVKVVERRLEADEGRSGVMRRVADGSGNDVRLDLVPYGGHNRVVTFATVTLAVQRAFDAAEALV
ncbi:Alpha/Beta hydrolase protein [Phyllosticta citribraziliensis]|uniref:Alpha/Beta hydrolase protein n=1 Tax=Phyllosticta citribraziliensis TaxID=989973 RepID=A0ABR1MAM5_9PEZI